MKCGLTQQRAAYIRHRTMKRYSAFGHRRCPLFHLPRSRRRGGLPQDLYRLIAANPGDGVADDESDLLVLLWGAGGGPGDGGGNGAGFGDSSGAAGGDADQTEAEVGAAGEGAELRGDLIRERCAEDAFAWWCADDQWSYGGEAIGDANGDGGGARPGGAVADAGGEKNIAGGANGRVVAHSAGGGVQQRERAGGRSGDDLPR
jgi:hypothetical protein